MDLFQSRSEVYFWLCEKENIRSCQQLGRIWRKTDPGPSCLSPFLSFFIHLFWCEPFRKKPAIYNLKLIKQLRINIPYDLPLPAVIRSKTIFPNNTTHCLYLLISACRKDGANEMGKEESSTCAAKQEVSHYLITSVVWQEASDSVKGSTVFFTSFVDSINPTTYRPESL